MTEIMNNAAEEYNYLYSVYVLEASTSNRLTYYFPPLNLISLVFRPLRLFVSADRLRSMRIVFLRITHAPHVAIILAFERLSAAATQNPKPWARMLSGPTSSESLSKRERAREAMRSSMIKSRSVRDKSRPRARFSTVEINGEHSSPLHSKQKQSHRAQAYSKLSGKENDSGSDREGSEEDVKMYDGANDMKEKDQMIAQLVAQVVRLTEKVEGLVEIVAKQQKIVLRDDDSADEEGRDANDDAADE